MPRLVAFLRAINVGGRTVTKDRLVAPFEAIGLTGVTTFIASGNVIFSTRARDLSALERVIEGALEEALGYEVATFLRSEKELRAMLPEAIFPRAALGTAEVVNVGLVRTAIDAERAARAAALDTPDDLVRAAGRELWWLSRGKQSESALFKVNFEKLLGQRVTFRRIDTIRRILAAHFDAE